MATRSRHRNPVPASSVEQQVFDASKRYQRFTGMKPDLVEWVEIQDVAALACIGEIDGIDYTTIRDGVEEKYRHKFGAKARPLFCVTPDGQMIVILGGGFTFTERGIVDQT